jgi:hypothetical protein
MAKAETPTKMKTKIRSNKITSHANPIINLSFVIPIDSRDKKMLCS